MRLNLKRYYFFRIDNDTRLFVLSEWAHLWEVEINNRPIFKADKPVSLIFLDDFGGFHFPITLSLECNSFSYCWLHKKLKLFYACVP